MNRRTEIRLPLQKECLLVNHSESIEAQVVDMSIMGIGVKTDRTLPFNFKNGCKLTISIPGMELPQVELMWTKKDVSNTTRLGLNFSASIIG